VRIWVNLLPNSQHYLRSKGRGTLKVINIEFGENIARLEMELKATLAMVGQEVDIREETGVPEAVEEPKSNGPTPL